MRLAVVVAVAGALAACGPRFLGEHLPAECQSSYAHCEAALQLRNWHDGYLTPTHLDAYVAQVEARISHASVLDYTPEVIIAPFGAAEVIGRSIVIGRNSIVLLGTEAELAAILAHETAHLEARLDETGYLGYPVDEESVADERGVALLGRAGYPTHAMASALGRIIKPDELDPNHPPIEFRLRRTTLAATDDRADDTRASHLDHIAGTVVGRDVESGVLIGNAWVFADRDIAVRLPAGLAFEDSDDHASAWDKRIHYGAWRLGPRTARDLAERLVVHEVLELPIGHVTIGVARPKSHRVMGSRERLIAQHERAVADVYDGELAAVIENARGGMVVSLTGGVTDDAMLRRWLTLIHPLTAKERALAVSPHLVLVRATQTGKVRDLVAACLDPTAALELDDPDRVIAAGERLKCTDRARVRGTSPAPPSTPPTP